MVRRDHKRGFNGIQFDSTTVIRAGIEGGRGEPISEVFEIMSRRFRTMVCMEVINCPISSRERTRRDLNMLGSLSLAHSLRATACRTDSRTLPVAAHAWPLHCRAAGLSSLTAAVRTGDGALPLAFRTGTHSHSLCHCHRVSPLLISVADNL